MDLSEPPLYTETASLIQEQPPQPTNGIPNHILQLVIRLHFTETFLELLLSPLCAFHTTNQLESSDFVRNEQWNISNRKTLQQERYWSIKLRHNSLFISETSTYQWQIIYFSLEYIIIYRDNTSMTIYHSILFNITSYV